MRVTTASQYALEKAKALDERAKVAQDFKIVNSTPEGSRALGYLMAFSGVFANSAPHDCNPNVTLFNDGRRSVGNEIMTLIVNEPDRFSSDALRKVAAQIEGTSFD